MGLLVSLEYIRNEIFLFVSLFVGVVRGQPIFFVCVLREDGLTFQKL